jgi:hypothetical protein
MQKVVGSNPISRFPFQREVRLAGVSTPGPVVAQTPGQEPLSGSPRRPVAGRSACLVRPRGPSKPDAKRTVPHSGKLFAASDRRGRMEARGRRTRAFKLALAVGLIALVVPQSAGGATIVGQTAPTSASVGQLGGPSMSVQHQVAGPPSYTVPDGPGVITSWSVQGGNSPSGQLKLKLVRREGTSTSYTVVGQAESHPIAQGTLNTFPAQIPVTGGELLALFVPAASISDDRFSTFATGDLLRFSPPVPEPGIGQSFDANSQTVGARSNVSAVVEPDCDGDGLGDESQDPQLALGEGCGKGNRAVTLDTNKSKVKKGRKVLLSGRLIATTGQGECLFGQTVELQRKKPSQEDFTTFTQVQSDGQGNFSLKQKVKKTYEFRVQVPETTSCLRGVSETEKVKVKKKK